MCVSVSNTFKAIKTTWNLHYSGHHGNLCHGLIFSTSFAREDKLHTACGGKSSITFCFKLGGFHILNVVLIAESREGACRLRTFGWLRVQFEGGHIMYRATCSDFICRYSYESHTALSCFGKKNCLGDGKMIRNRKCLESNGLFSSTAHIPLHKCFTMPSSSPSHFWITIFSVNLGKGLQSRSICLSCFSKDVAWKKVCYLPTAN